MSYTGEKDCPVCHGHSKNGDCTYCFCDHGVKQGADCAGCKEVEKAMRGELPEQIAAEEAEEKVLAEIAKADWDAAVEEKRKLMSEDEDRDVSSEEAANKLQAEAEAYHEQAYERHYG